MNRVHVVVVPTENEVARLQPDGSNISEGTALRKYVSWVPFEYLAGQLKQDVARYWQIKPAKYELYDPLGNVLADDKLLESVHLHPAILQLKRRERARTMATRTTDESANINDPFWIHNQLFDLFVFSALQNRQTKTLRITSYQFKHLLQKATAKTIFQRKRKLNFDKRVALAFRGGAYLKRNAEFNRARIHFLLEFNKMHREDSLVDYQSGCPALLRMKQPSGSYVPANPAMNDVYPAKQDVNPAEQDVDPAKQDEEDFDAEFTWDLDAGEDGEVENTTYESDSSVDSAVSRTPTCQIDPETLAEMKKRELEQLTALSHEADEIYAFLASELQRHALSKRSDDPNTVPHMLDVWVSAGEKYSDVITHVETSPLLRAKFLARFGRSLYVFASQVLKSTTKVYNYEELFYVTNARVYTVDSDLWRDSSTLFTLDLAMETLSLASGKLTQASDELSALITTARASDSPSENDDDTSSVGSGDDDEALAASALYDRYLFSLYLRANCLAAYGDVLAHCKKVVVDFELGCCFDETSQIDERPTTREPFFTSTIVLSKTSSPGNFYWEAKKMYRFLVQHSKGGLNFSRGRLYHNLAMAQFKLATQLPRGCEAEKQLLENALRNLDSCGQAPDPVLSSDILSAKSSYIRAILAVRRKFFLAESLYPTPAEGEVRDTSQDQEESLAPFYRFVLAAAFGELDPEKKGVILHPDLTLLSRACGHNAVSPESLQWLLESFDHQDGGLTERGVLQYFCWLAEADPIGFCEIIDLLTAKHTGAHNISIFSGDCLYPRKQSALKASSASRKISATGLRTKRAGIADCVVVLSGKNRAAGVDISRSTSVSDIRLEPEVVDVLPTQSNLPEELSKFCFPDDIYLSSESFSPKTFDIVLTDIKGVRSYGTCLHFWEEKHPMDVLGLMSATEKGRTANLPSWVSLKDIQQGQTKWKCYAPKCLCVLSSSPLFQTFRDFLVYLYRLSLSNVTNPTDTDVGKALQRHDELVEKWSEIQNLFSAFAMRLLKEVRKYCTKALSSPSSSMSSNETVVFDERGFLAMHPSLRDFCTHLFQTQLFQRSIENIWGFK
ncbi:hypothetical protein PHYBOEH_008035 [Phytophthora boehmeriae]|uniref:uDENN domain-containing protein n=1 Tax=Phytophthora boehmeriae TaxID=109152 RepID=A0A8T1W419_9STRA|nr:hypothetical protein PHYBOEH_008035 [Phytophthora boehmeriae]